MQKVEDVAPLYLGEPGPHLLEIGTGRSFKAGWLCTDLEQLAAVDGSELPAVHYMDATQPFPLPSDAFDAVYTEHTIEHLSLLDGMRLAAEAFRVLKSGGVLRVVTPSLGFLLRMTSIDKDLFEQRYFDWALDASVPDAPIHSAAVFLNNFVRAWGHRFIYDRPTLRITMERAGFTDVRECGLLESAIPAMAGIANVGRMPPGFLALESMIMEGRKP